MFPRNYVRATRLSRTIPAARPLLSLMVFSMLAISVRADNWPAWRGPTGDGVSTEKGLPIHWSAKENARWSTELPDRGNSTPVVWGDRVIPYPIHRARGAAHGDLLRPGVGEGKIWRSGIDDREKESTHEVNPVLLGLARDGWRAGHRVVRVRPVFFATTLAGRNYGAGT